MLTCLPNTKACTFQPLKKDYIEIKNGVRAIKV